MKHRFCKRFWISMISVICAAALLMTGASAGTLSVSGQTPGSTEGEDQTQSSNEMMEAILNSILADISPSEEDVVTVTIEPGDALIDCLKNILGVDFSWLDSVDLSIRGGLYGFQSAFSAELLLNGFHLLTVEYVVDMSGGLMYMRIPDFSDTYIRIDLTETYAEAFREIYGNTTVNFDEILEELTPMIFMGEMMLRDGDVEANVRNKTLTAAAKILAAIAEDPIVVTTDGIESFMSVALASTEPAEQDSGEQNGTASDESAAAEEAFSIRVPTLYVGESTLSGEILLRIGDYMTSLLLSEAGLPTLAESIDVSVVFDSKPEMSEIVCDLMDGSDRLLRLSLRSEKGEIGTAPVVESSCDMEEWSNEVMMNGGLEAFMERLYMSDIPDELLNMMFYGTSGEMYGASADMYGTSGEATGEMSGM